MTSPSRRPGLRRVRAGTTAALLIAVAVVVTTLGGPVLGSSSGFSASISNGSDTLGSASVLPVATDTTSGVTDCTAVASPITAASSFPCTGSLLPASVPTTGAAAHSIALTDAGTAPASSATLTALSCGPVDLVNSEVATDPMLVRGGATFAQPGPFSGGGSLGLDGSTALAADVTSQSEGALLGSNFSEGIWFKTAAGATGGGGLLGLGNSPEAADTSDDAALWMTSSGQLTYSVSGTLGVTATGTTSAKYNDGAWHLAVLTVSTLATTLIVDGSVAATGIGLTLLSTYTGYVHVGWLLPGAAGYFGGNLSDAFLVAGTALSTAVVGMASSAGSQGAFVADLLADGASSLWTLADSGTTTYAGPYPVIGATSPCTMVAATAGGTSFCVEPASAGACAAVASTSPSLAAWVAAGAQPLPPVAPAAVETLTVTCTEGSTYAQGFLPGLHLLLPVTLTETVAGAPGWTDTLTWLAEQVIV